MQGVADPGSDYRLLDLGDGQHYSLLQGAPHPIDRNTVIASLKQHQAELTELGIVSLSIIGSIAREEATSASDVDLAATLTPGRRGFAHLERMDQLRERLGKMLGCAVDVIEEPSPLLRVQRAIERDRVLAF
jgi:uncharacterized protein